jgi:hypothetical protein
MSSERAALPAAFAGVLAAGVLFAVPAARACDSAACAAAMRAGEGRPAAGRWRAELSIRYVDQGGALFGGRSVNDVWRRRVDLARGGFEPFLHRETGGDLRLLQLDLTRGFGAGRSLRLGLPLVRRQSASFLHPGPVRDVTTGIGDVQLGADARVLARGSNELAVGLMLKLPTGAASVAGADGVVDPMLQPGTGSVDGIASLQGARRGARLAWSGAASYQHTTTNGRGYRRGDEAVATLGALQPLGRRLEATLQLKVQSAERDRFGGVPVLATGGTSVHLAAGLRIRVPGAALRLVAQRPLRTRVNESQRISRLAVTVGLTKVF